jgi:hypothetical protein
MFSLPRQRDKVKNPPEMSRFFKLSKGIHKYIGLALILFLMWMSVSGILLNHPELIADISVPHWLVPSQYKVENWNRSSLIQLFYSKGNPDIAYAGGKQGVWKTADSGKTFQPLTKGFPTSHYYRKTNSVFLWEQEQSLLLAGTNGGLYACNPETEKWRKIPLQERIEPVKKIIRIKNSLVVFSDSRAYASPLPPHEIHFHLLPLTRAENVQQVTLVRLFFDLHDGSVWGLGGRLLFDIAGIILFFLSISAFYSWYYPRKRGREKAQNRPARSKRIRRLFKWFFKYHLKLGIWFAAILLIIGGTGMFMRPPLLAVLADKNVPRIFYPGPLPDNPWDKKIHNALYDAVKNRIIIQATDGLWAGPADFSRPFENADLQIPIFVMGATVFEPYGSGGYLIGSFNGIFHWERATGNSVDILTGQIAKNISSVRPAEKMITGYFKTPAGEEFITAHEQGLLPVGNAEMERRFSMPPEMATYSEPPLWNYLFEIHNGRFFKDLIGSWYILVVPIGSMLFVLITLSGIYDWFYLKVLRK